MLPTMVLIGTSERIAIDAAMDRAKRIPLKAEEVKIPVGYRVVVSFEEHSTGIYLHLAISLDRPNEPKAMPTPQAIRVICAAFDVAFPIEARIWDEPDGPTTHIYVAHR